ncbi:MAG: hypothetical protein IT426_00130 [Pirellulales bacterium]|nr:hypothetical protein [Pirellulales bacterium]
MTQPIRFFFDECISHLIVEQQIRDSLQLYGADAEVAHLFSKFPSGTPDSQWIPELSKEGGWIVISADRGINSRAGEKLPIICHEFNLTHVMLSRGLHKRTMYYKALAIESSWFGLISAASEPPGTGFMLSMTGQQAFRLKKVSDAKQIDTASEGYLFNP